MDLTNPVTQQIIGGVIRSVIIAIGGGAIMTGNQESSLAGALAVVLGIGWSIWQKRKTAANSHATLTTAVQATAASPADASAIIAQAKAGKF